MYTIKIPKQVHFVKCNNKHILGSGSAVFCFYDKEQAAKIVKHLDNTPNCDVWNSPVNPTRFLLYPNKDMRSRKNYNIVTENSEDFINKMVSNNVGIRFVDNVLQHDVTSYSLSSFCGIEGSQSQEDSIAHLRNVFDIDGNDLN